MLAQLNVDAIKSFACFDGVSGAAHNAFGRCALDVQGHEEAVFHQAAGCCGLVQWQLALCVLVAIARRNGGGNAEPDAVGFKVKKLGVFNFNDGCFAG